MKFLTPALLTLTLPMLAAEPFRQTLISSGKNIRVETAEFSGRKLTPKAPGWTIRKRTLHGGKQEGVEVIVVNNGKLEFTVVPTRGMGVLEAKVGDVRLGWNSPVKEVVHPRHINLMSRGGLGWLDGFNEWMVRCGLESNGGPGPDEFTNNVGDKATMDLTLHGKIANIPASEVEIIVDRNPPYQLTVRGIVDERMFYGPKLELVTEISTDPGSQSLRIADTITNRGDAEQEFELLYHANYGRPLLEMGSRLLAPVARVTPMNERAAKAIGSYAEYARPTPGYVELVYCIVPLADAGGRTLIALQNKQADRAVSMAYSVKELPYLTQWKNTAAEGEGYVTGLEPGVNFPNPRRIERKLGRVPKLAPGASYTAAIDYAIHSDAEAVEAVAKRIAKLQGDTKPQIDTEPEKKD
ncbi:MAG: aldose 1-epimerase family protein [Chthoniobacteraceae bacterium]